MISAKTREQILKKCKSELTQKTLQNRVPKTIGMFDLYGSTLMKLNKGHEKAMNSIRFHNCICIDVINKTKGHVMKELGDGVLAVFDDPVDACVSAIQIRNLMKVKNHKTKISLSFGLVEPQQTKDGKLDYVGSAVDFCAKVEKYAQPNQILIDEEVFGLIKTYAHSNNIRISNPMSTIIENQEKKLFEITNKKSRLINRLNLPLKIEPKGHLMIKEHVLFLEFAKKNIIEMGLDLHHFVEYLTEQSVSTFKKYIKDLMNKDVSITCYLLEPEWALKNLSSSYNVQVVSNIEKSLHLLSDFKKECIKEKIKGKLNIRTYAIFPLIHVIGSDVYSKTGKISVSHNLFGVDSTSNPTLQTSQESNPDLFGVYRTTINAIHKNSKVWKRF